MTLWERARIGAMVGASGGLVMALISAAAGGTRGLLWHDLPFVAMAFAGATAAGLGLARLFGAEGRLGWGLAVLGAVLTTWAGAALAATLVLGPQVLLQGLLLGPGFVGAWILSSPPVAVGWAGSMALVHRLARAIRRGTVPMSDSDWRAS